MSQKHPRQFAAIVVIAVLTLIQGILYILPIIWSFFLSTKENCNSKSINFGLIMYFSHFIKSNECENVIWPPSGDYETYVPDATHVAERTYIAMILYAVISVIWIITSLMAFKGAFCSKLSKTTFYTHFLPWFLAVIAGSIVDVVLTVFHVKDILKTRTLNDTLKYLGVQNFSHAGDVSKDYVYLPIVMTCISARLIIFWLINIIGIFIALKQARNITKRIHQNLSHDTLPRGTTTPPMLEKMSDSKNHSPLSHPHSRKSGDDNDDDNFNQHEEYYAQRQHQQYHHHQQHQGKRRDRRTGDPLNSEGRMNYDERITSDYNNRHNELSNRDRSSLSADELSRYNDISSQNYNRFHKYEVEEESPITYRRHQHHQQPYRYPLPTDEGNRASYRPPTSNGHIKDENRNFTNNHEMDVEDERRISPRPITPFKNRESFKDGKPHVADELRSQLPWSYFDTRELTTPRKALVHVEEHEVLPPIPVPDYTLHFPKSERPSVRMDS